MIVHRSQQAAPRRGIILVAVLVVVVLLALAAYQYSDLMLAEYQASLNAHRAYQARAFADSGVHYAAAMIANRAELNGNIFDNADAFRDIQVGGGDVKRLSGRFMLLAAADEDSSSAGRNGVTDETGKINVNAFMKRDPTGKLLYDALLKLPNVTTEIAAKIVDWLDADNETRQDGAESDYYSGLSPPYRCKNGPLDSLDELLLVVTREVLYGNDLNRNGIQDPGEGADDGGFSRGLSAYLTVYSRELNADTQGQALTYINESDLAAFYEKVSAELGDDMAKFMVMYRQYGASTGSNQSQQSTNQAGPKRGKGAKGGGGGTVTIQGKLTEWTPDFTKKDGLKKISSMFDLIDAEVSISTKVTLNGKDQDAKVVYTSPLKETAQRRELLPKLFDSVTIYEESDIPARVNVNTAPREVLAALPDLTEADVQAILAQRPKLSATEPASEIYATPAWLMTEANLKADTLKKLEKTITTKSQVYHVQAIGYFDDGGPAARVEAVIDAPPSGRPRIIMWRDLSELGASRPPMP